MGKHQAGFHLKYEAICAECGAELKVGDLGRVYGRGKNATVYGTQCHKDNRPKKRKEADVKKYFGNRKAWSDKHRPKTEEPKAPAKTAKKAKPSGKAPEGKEAVIAYAMERGLTPAQIVALLG